MTQIDEEFARAEASLRASVAKPEAVQHELLMNVLRTNQDTVFGKEYDFASIRDAATYRARVPVQDYKKQIRPYIERMYAGEPDVLFQGLPSYWGKTTGTTSVPKLVGFNPRVRSEYVHMLGPMVALLERDFPGASRETMLVTAPYEEEVSPTGLSVGNASGFVRRALDEHPYFRIMPEPIYECLDADARIYGMLLVALTRDIRCFASLFPTILTTLFRRASELGEQLAADLERGELAAAPPGAAFYRNALAPRLRPMPERARRLREIVRANGRFVPDEYWEHVEVIHTWKGATAKHILPELQSMFRRAQIRPMSSGSTEASLMVALDPTWTGGIPALCSTMIDFLPADAEVDARHVVTLRDLEPNKGYRLVVTNHRGLYRYVMEDVFMIEGVHEGVPYLNLEHRVGIVANFSGEKVTEEAVSTAVEHAMKSSGLDLVRFQVMPEQQTGGATVRYAVYAELREAPAPSLARAFLGAFEAHMTDHNINYKLYRGLGSVAPAVLYRVKPGFFERLARERAAARGRSDVQFKLTALYPLMVAADGDSIDATFMM